MWTSIKQSIKSAASEIVKEAEEREKRERQLSEELRNAPLGAQQYPNDYSVTQTPMNTPVQPGFNTRYPVTEPNQDVGMYPNERGGNFSHNENPYYGNQHAANLNENPYYGNQHAANLNGTFMQQENDINSNSAADFFNNSFPSANVNGNEYHEATNANENNLPPEAPGWNYEAQMNNENAIPAFPSPAEENMDANINAIAPSWNAEARMDFIPPPVENEMNPGVIEHTSEPISETVESQIVESNLHKKLSDFDGNENQNFGNKMVSIDLDDQDDKDNNETEAQPSVTPTNSNRLQSLREKVESPLTMAVRGTFQHLSKLNSLVSSSVPSTPNLDMDEGYRNEDILKPPVQHSYDTSVKEEIRFDDPNDHLPGIPVQDIGSEKENVQKLLKQMREKAETNAEIYANSDDMDKRIKSLWSEFKKTKTRLPKVDRIEDLKLELAAKEKENKTMQVTLSEKESVIRNLDIQVREKCELLTQAERKMNANSESSNEWQDQLTEKNEMISKLEAELEQQIANVQKVQHQLTEKDETISKLEVDLEHRTANIQSLSAQLERTKESESHSLSTQNLAETISELNQTIDELEDKLDVSRNRCKALEEENKTVKLEMEEEFRAIVSSIQSESYQESENLKIEEDTNIKQLQSLKAQFRDAQSRRAALESENEARKIAISKLKMGIENTKRLFKEASDKLAEQREEKNESLSNIKQQLVDLLGSDSKSILDESLDGSTSLETSRRCLQLFEKLQTAQVQILLNENSYLKAYIRNLIKPKDLETSETKEVEVQDVQVGIEGNEGEDPPVTDIMETYVNDTANLCMECLDQMLSLHAVSTNGTNVVKQASETILKTVESHNEQTITKLGVVGKALLEKFSLVSNFENSEPELSSSAIINRSPEEHVESLFGALRNPCPNPEASESENSVKGIDHSHIYLDKFIQHIASQFQTQSEEVIKSKEMVHVLVTNIVKLISHCLSTLPLLREEYRSASLEQQPVSEDTGENLVDNSKEAQVVETEENSNEKDQDDGTCDRKLAANVVITCIERNCRHDCLEVVARVLDFTPEQRKRVGLDQSSGFWSAIIPDWSRGQARAEQVNVQDQSLSNLLDDFIRDETS